MLFESLQGFVMRNSFSLTFYAVLILIIVFFRRKIEWQAPFVGMYKTQVGVPLMKKWSEKYREFVKWLGYCGIGIGFLGMGFILWSLGDGLYKLFFMPDAPPVVAPVIPGFTIPGYGISVPLITGWLALFVVIVIHEFSHGVVSKAHKIPIKSSGLLVFGPIFGAFVEPDEKKLEKADSAVQQSIFAAGPFSNILTGFFFVLLAGFVFLPLLTSITTPMGVELATIDPGLPAESAGIQPGTIITFTNGQETLTTQDFISALSDLSVGDTVTLADVEGNTYSVVAAQHSTDPEKAVIGVRDLESKRQPAQSGQGFGILVAIVQWLSEFVEWIFILSLGIGLANLLPLGPVDGGQMIRRLFTDIFGEKRGINYWSKVTIFTLVLLLVLLIVPMVSHFF